MLQRRCFILLHSHAFKMSLNEEQRSIILSHTNRLTSTRQYPKTVCPSEIARAFSAEELETLHAQSWRDTMEIVRKVVWELRAEGGVEVLQKGEVLSEEVGMEDVRGPIRVRATRS